MTHKANKHMTGNLAIEPSISSRPVGLMELVHQLLEPHAAHLKILDVGLVELGRLPLASCLEAPSPDQPGTPRRRSKPRTQH